MFESIEKKTVELLKKRHFAFNNTDFAVLVGSTSHNSIVLDDRKRSCVQKIEQSIMVEEIICKKIILKYLNHTSEQRATLFVTP